jgi:hypothetical protein
MLAGVDRLVTVPLGELLQRGKPGRPVGAKAIHALIHRMSRAHPTWGSPRSDKSLFILHKLQPS